jgi:DNA-binding response OmpR family regulator
MSEKDRILVVDDDTLILDLVTDALTAEGYLVERASNGGRAINMLRTGHYDLVLTDFQMPVRNGVDVVREARRLHLRVPVLVLTASALGDDARVLEALGVYRILGKPIMPRALSEAVEESLHEREVERREVGRITLDMPCSLSPGRGSGEVAARMVSLSVKGASVRVRGGAEEMPAKEVGITVSMGFPSRTLRLRAKTKHMFVDSDGTATIGLQFDAADSEALDALREEILLIA